MKYGIQVASSSNNILTVELGLWVLQGYMIEDENTFFLHAAIVGDVHYSGVGRIRNDTIVIIELLHSINRGRAWPMMRFYKPALFLIILIGEMMSRRDVKRFDVEIGAGTALHDRVYHFSNCFPFCLVEVLIEKYSIFFRVSFLEAVECRTEFGIFDFSLEVCLHAACIGYLERCAKITMPRDCWHIRRTQNRQHF